MRLAVVSPFVDRRHGTERALAELLERLARNYHCEIHLFSQRVEDLLLSDPRVPRSGDAGAIVWHKVPAVPGPHLFQFLAWLALNTIWRKFSVNFGGLSFDLLLSPGINCLDADAIIVHSLFHRVREVSAGDASSSAQTGIFRRMHRKFYYALLCALEKHIYPNPRILLAGVSQRTANLLSRYFNRQDVHVIPNGIDLVEFSAAARICRRAEARRQLDLNDDHFVLLLIGNDWRLKGLPSVLQAMRACSDLPFRLLVVGQDSPDAYQSMVRRLGILDRCRWISGSPDVLSFYAAADVYVSPTLEDAFALPPLEAMACGLPVITSVNSGCSQIITEGVDGFVLQDPRDTRFLEILLRRLYEQPDLRQQIGKNASATARSYTWDRNAADTWRFLNSTARQED